MKLNFDEKTFLNVLSNGEAYAINAKNIKNATGFTTRYIRTLINDLRQKGYPIDINLLKVKC